MKTTCVEFFLNIALIILIIALYFILLYSIYLLFYDVYCHFIDHKRKRRERRESAHRSNEWQFDCSRVAENFPQPDYLNLLIVGIVKNATFAQSNQCCQNDKTGKIVYKIVYKFCKVLILKRWCSTTGSQTLKKHSLRRQKTHRNTIFARGFARNVRKNPCNIFDYRDLSFYVRVL